MIIVDHAGMLITVNERKKGLPVEIYRSGYDSRLNILYGKRTVLLVGNGIPEIFSETEDMPAVKIIEHKAVKGYMIARPFDSDGTGMFGGTFIWSSDSRFRHFYPLPIPLHDRVE